MIEDLRRKIAHNHDLDAEDMAFFLKGSITGELTQANKIEVLTLQCNKGISSDELVSATKILQRQDQKTEAMDVCGTGGSGLRRINTSTLAAFVLSALGVKIAKHGNRAASGRFGSFDLLEKLGINIDLSPEQSQKVFDSSGLGFFFAPKCYPGIGAFALARKAMKKPTMFNLLGPLLSPLNPKKQIIGTSTEQNARLLIEAAIKLGKESIYVVVGDMGLDEVSPTGPTLVFNEKNKKTILHPHDFGVETVSFSEIAGGDAQENVQIARSFLSGEKNNTPHADLVHMNVALALQLNGIEKDLFRGMEISRTTVSEKKAEKMLQKVIDLSHSV